MSDDEEWKSSFVQGDDAALTAAIKAREAECDPLLRRGPSADPVKALALSLADPPYATRTAAVKDAATELVCKCMASASDIDAAIGTLSLEQCDVLMKYIYRGCARARNFGGTPRCARARAACRRPPSPRSPAAAAQARPQREGAVSLHFSPQMAPGGDEKSRPGVDHEDDLGGPAGNLERGMGIRDLSPEKLNTEKARANFARRRRAQRDVPSRQRSAPARCRA
jgi:actin related protein 2/3 complex subunit 5